MVYKAAKLKAKVQINCLKVSKFVIKSYILAFKDEQRTRAHTATTQRVAPAQL